MTTAQHDNKITIVVDAELPAGLAANTAAVLALTLGHQIESLMGPEVKDGDGNTHPGITTVPMPILTADKDKVKQIRSSAADQRDVGLFIVDFTDCAQQTRTYDDYTRRLEVAAEKDMTYLGIALHGPRKPIQRLTGSLPLLR